MNSMPALMQSWWVLGLRGLVALLFGLCALFLPGMTLLGLIALFAIYAILAGLVAIFGALRSLQHARGPRAPDWWLLLVLGLIGVATGIIAAMRPTLTMMLLVMVIGINAVLTGALDLVALVRVRRYAPPEGTALWALSALVSIVFGVAVIVLPELGALTLVWMVSIYALLVGLLYLVQSWRAAGVQRAAAPDAAPERPASQPERRLRERRMTPSHS